jgi:hypothetical protein
MPISVKGHQKPQKIEMTLSPSSNVKEAKKQPNKQAIKKCLTL